MGSTSRHQILHLRGEKTQQAASMGTIHVGYSDSYRKLKWTLNGAAEVHEELDLVSPWLPLFSLQVLPCELRHPTLLHSRLSAELLSCLWGVQPQSLQRVADSITSRAWDLSTQPPSSSGYSIVAELEFLVVEEDFENFDAHTLWRADQEGGDWAPMDAGDHFEDSLDRVVDESEGVLDQLRLPNVDSVLVLDDVDLALKCSGLGGGSRSAIKKLIKKGGFVANESDQELLGTCSVCLEELSSPEGAKLLRMDCSHLYHQACILPWLEKQNTCPTCRREVGQ
ncbi:hypothetical protein FH972_018217 [Carpinus fangiana]|uniref:RING-type domain-containing protein n=1 Tax=Carpinus fangiana TaxID=176857 RepID=A0A5N6RPC4_9ROSI|nr:hypothetical protein FH972_018217 [Carpinus fangiana]